ncbi:biotin--[acetyl-CoA-carboxylase] ligase [Bacillus sp. 2205SS5-2]|uniref:biotin--[acetyl-CoA-carboxylase] ligase n=1 Tax=Bacillus sp. 2205SS5-2 TaxID=3109031 RepID=UPI00300584ED
MQSPIRKKIVEAFAEAQGAFLSGQDLANETGCSRTAVWKHIEELRKEGYELEAVRKKGYRILQAPDKVSEDELLMGLATEKLGRVIHYNDSVESTQKLAHILVHDHVPEGTIVIAEEQTAGRGRLMRKWDSPKYTGIWMSVILRPNLPPQKAPQFTLISAVAVVQAIRELTDVEAEIKWPNDLLINGKKITGILTELVAESDKINAVIIGIGINVNQQVESFSEEIKDVATSIRLEGGKPVSRAALVQQILLKLEKYYSLYMREGFYPIKLLWESYAISIGKDIMARTMNETIYGKAMGITDEGVLLVREESGEIREIYSADIQIQSD